MEENILSPLEKACEFLNDIIGETGVVARPGDTQIIWMERVINSDSEVSEEHIIRSVAYQRLFCAGFNPLKLIVFVCNKYSLEYTWT